MATRIDGKAMAATISARITEETSALKQQHGLVPGLAVVIVGEDAASQVYVRNKQRTAEACGFKSDKHALPADVAQGTLLKLIDELNADLRARVETLERIVTDDKETLKRQFDKLG